jgi:antitoxin component of RelBE/YafQ-DinJ toxin-antitoxin module
MQTARRRLFNVRFSEEEHARLDAICEHLGVNASSLVRMLLREKERALQIEPQPSRSRVTRRSKK